MVTGVILIDSIGLFWFVLKRVTYNPSSWQTAVSSQFESPVISVNFPSQSCLELPLDYGYDRTWVIIYCRYFVGVGIIEDTLLGVVGVASKRKRPIPS